MLLFPTVNPTSKPPVCKIQNYHKYMLEKNKKEKELRLKQKPVKEMMFGVRAISVLVIVPSQALNFVLRTGCN